MLAHEADIGFADGDDGLGTAGRLRLHCRLYLLAQGEEGEVDDGVEQRCLVAEMPIGRRAADAGTARSIHHGEVCAAPLLDQLGGGENQGVAQVAMVIGGCPAVHEITSFGVEGVDCASV